MYVCMYVQFNSFKKLCLDLPLYCCPSQKKTLQDYFLVFY